MSLLENIEVEPARPKARVVINARTGTIVIGGDVKVTPTAVTHGKLTVSIQEDTAVVSEAQGAMQMQIQLLQVLQQPLRRTLK